MNKTTFNHTIRSVSTKGRLDLQKVAGLSDKSKAELVNYIVRQRGPIVKELIPAGFDTAWLHSCGYLYETRGLIFTFVHTSEHHILTQQDQVMKDARALSSGTISCLIKRTDYRAIDIVQAAFVDFCIDHAGEFENWKTAWHEFDLKFDYTTLEPFTNQFALVDTPDGPQYSFAPAADAQLALGI